MPDNRNTDALSKDLADGAKGTKNASFVKPFALPELPDNLDESTFFALYDAAMSVDRSQCHAALEWAINAGISREDLADYYIPSLSRFMGDQWCEDELGFAGVTIGVSRLQSMLRDLGPDWSGDKAADPAASAIMLIVPTDAFHTLGAMVLAGQLRRKGLSARLMLGAQPDEIRERLQKSCFDAVFISASRGEALETLRRIVDVVRASTDKPPPVVIGGSLLEVETKEDVTALTGADHATPLPDEAIELCDLKTMRSDNRPKMRGA